MNYDINFTIKAGAGQITFPIYRVPVSGGVEPLEPSEIENLMVSIDKQVLEASQSGVNVTAAYSDVAEGKHVVAVSGSLNNASFYLLYGVRAEELGVPAEVTAPNAYVSLEPTGEGTIEQQLQALRERMTAAEGDIDDLEAAVLGITTNYATKAEMQETLGEILAAIQALPDGQAVSAQVALNTAAIEALQGEVSQLGQYVEHTEWVRVVIDSNDKILYGVKTDGKFYFGDGCPPQVQEYVQAQIDAIGIDALLATKVDKVTGKSLIDADFASSQSAIESLEFLEVKIDSDNKILETITPEGRKQINTPVDFNSANGKNLQVEELQFGDATGKNIVIDTIEVNEEIVLSEEAKEKLKEDISSSNNLENKVVSGFNHDFTYDSSDYSYSEVTDYSSESTPYTKDKPSPITVNWGIDIDNVASSIICKTFDEEGNLVRTDTFSSWSGNKVDIYNLTPCKEYKYKLFYTDSLSMVHQFSCGIISTSGQIRMISIDGVKNIRDIGGWPTINGGIMKYGKIYRSAILQSEGYGNITPAGISELIDNIGLDVELNFNGNSSPISSYVELLGSSDYRIDAYDNGLDPSKPTYTGQEYVNSFNALLQRLKSNKVILFHCLGGADRTGTFAFILEALCGVSESDLSKDYELTSFAGWVRERSNSSYTGLINYIKNSFSGSTLNEKVEAMMISLGVTAQDIEDFRGIMID